MQISPISNNNPNFQQLKVSRSVLRGLGTTKNALLENEFLKKWSEEFDIFINGTNGSWFRKPTEFAISLSEKSKVLFTGLDELDKAIDGIKASLYKKHAEAKYSTELNILKNAENGIYFLFESRNEVLIPSIASIPDKPEYKEIRERFLSILKSLRVWFPVTNDKGKSVALLALENNNLELLKFLLSKGENPNQCLDLMKRGLVSDEAREILKDVKEHDARIFDLEHCDNDYTRQKMLELNANIDINSRNRHGDTLVTRAFKTGNLELLSFLKTIDGVNWNAYDSNGKNIALIALDTDKSIHDSWPLIDFVRCLGDEKYDINACGMGKLTITSPIEEAVTSRNCYIEYITKFKNTNVMEQLRENDEPLVFRAIDEVFLTSNFRDLITHPSFDFFGKTKYGENVVEYAAIHASKDKIDCINEQIPHFIINKARQLYDKNGELTIEEMNFLLDALIDNNANRSLVNSSINVFDEGFGHLMCDINVDINDSEKMREMSSLLDKLVEAGSWECKDKQNCLDMDMIEKAIEGENLGLIKLLVERFNLSQNEYKKALDKCSNPEVKKLFRGDMHEN